MPTTVSLHGQVFISYEPADGLEVALWLADRFTECKPPVPFWIAEKNITSLDTAIDDVTVAIQKCSCLVLVATSGAVAQGSRAAQEWKLAFTYRKAVIVAAAEECELPPHLARRPQIAIRLSSPGTFEALCGAIASTDTIKGLLSTAQHYKRDAEHARMYGRGHATARIDAEIEELDRTIASLSETLSDVAAARDRLDQRIRLGINRQRAPRDAQAPEIKIPFVNKPPIDVPDYFQNRFVETKMIADFLRSEAGRLLVVSGQGGVGKSALVCRILRQLERGTLPDDHGELRVAGIVYLTFIGHKVPSLGNVFEGLVQLLPAEWGQRLVSFQASRQMPMRTKVAELLAAFAPDAATDPAIVLLDKQPHDGARRRTCAAITLLPASQKAAGKHRGSLSRCQFGDLIFTAVLRVAAWSERVTRSLDASSTS